MLHHVGIRARVLMAFLVSLLFFGGALVYGLLQLRAIGLTLVVVDVGYLPLAAVSADMQAVVRQLERDADRLAQGGRPVEAHRANARFYESLLEEGLDEARDTIGAAVHAVPGSSEAVALQRARVDVEAVAAALVRYQEAFSKWAADGDSTAAKVRLDRSRKELGNAIRELGAFVEGRIGALSERAVRAQNRALGVTAALSMVALVMAGLLGWAAVLTLRPITLLTQQVQRLAEGESTARVDVAGADEVALLGREFNAMADAVSARDRVLKERAEALDRLSLRLRQVIDTIQSGLVVVEDGVVRTLNPAAARVWSLTEGQTPPEPFVRLQDGRHFAIPLGDRLVDLSVAPFGETGRLVVGEDVTERIRDRERLARSERLALVGQMLAQITHEVRNPLNAISLNTELLAEDVSDPEAVAMLATITGEIRRLEALTARYLDLSRRRQPELVQEDPIDVVREVARIEGPALDQAGVSMEIVGEALGVCELDGDALRRVLRNLILNAMEAGATHLKVALRREDHTAMVSVTDDGPGMDPTQLSQIFEPFFTTKAKGTGLGLAISRQELEDVGGSLKVSSEPGTGTTFQVVVPFVDIS